MKRGLACKPKQDASERGPETEGTEVSIEGARQPTLDAVWPHPRGRGHKCSQSAPVAYSPRHTARRLLERLALTWSA